MVVNIEAFSDIILTEPMIHPRKGERAKRSKLFFHYGCGTTPGIQPRAIARKLWE